ncbi:hypothetical protein KBF38_23785 [bacterium]|nr:hypothetical protein [bacterium]
MANENAFEVASMLTNRGKNEVRMTELAMEIIAELQKLKTTVTVRTILLESQTTSLKTVMMKDLDDVTPANVASTLDNVLGDLGSGYHVQCSELQANGQQIKRIEEKLEQLYNKLLMSDSENHHK